MKWKEELRYNITEACEVKDLLKLDAVEEEQMCRILDRFPMTIPRYYYSLIDRENPDQDPIRKMCIPSVEETDVAGDFDTSGEAENTVMPGMQHKYRETVMILSTNRCAMYCRHCFRKRLVGISDDETAENVEDMVEYVSTHKEISNVLISGGDAFLNSNEVIRRYLEAFSRIEHLDLIRFGTRTLVSLPKRIYEDPELIEMLKQYNRTKKIYVMTHVNHPKELTGEAKRAVGILNRAGITVKNQMVLLKGVNDSGETVGKLLREMTACGIIPYYIFQCRPVTGVKNQFQVPLERGYEIVEEAKHQQNGQGKCLRYVLSHVTGKIEILGNLPNGRMLFKYHQAKEEGDQGRIFTQRLKEGQTWLDEIP
ncbi:KamA family radical SAM protein [Ruminococcus sp. OA3]|uniref:KamA family radical SAM protein n=1 Tax=Ruminococcus sp. OA3 TaxID=2914164 RepID=UPI001F058347|nr:KamA family radical SAM protein [Ruminococcus sp. OA3]MCH1983196.1 KamA family radical SAM protein [Ruminococcus sp. OA3]